MAKQEKIKSKNPVC